MSNKRTEIGGRIRRKRNEMGLNQTEVAERLQLSRVAYAQYETGRSSIAADTLWELAQVFSVPIGYFYGEKDFDIDTLSAEFLFDRLPIICKQTIRAFMVHMLMDKKAAATLVRMLEWGDDPDLDTILDAAYDARGRAKPGGPIPVQTIRLGTSDAAHLE